MYEIWLMLNIVWELALAIWPWLLALAVLWLLLMARAVRRPGAAWRGSLLGALALAALAAISTFLLAPGWVHSSLAELKYWIDWATLLGIAAAGGALVLAFAWPLLVGLRARPSA